MMPYINFFGLSVSTYWTMCAIGMLLVLVFSIAQSKRYGLQLWQAVVMAICINAFGIVGVYLLGFIQSGFDSFNTSFMGALIFTPVFLATVAKLFKINVLEGISFSAVPIASMGACMKIGCFFAGCCGGITINGNVFPVQLLESFISIIIVAALLIIQKKTDNLKLLFVWYMLMYSVTRFFVEFLRNSAKNLLFLSIGQVTAVIVCLIAITSIVIIRKTLTCNSTT